MESKKSSWSAFIDGELTELEELRLIRESDLAGMALSVYRWSEARNKLAAQQDQPLLSVDEQVILNQRIVAALDEEGELVARDTARARSLWPMAAAASLVFAVAVGLFIQSTFNVQVDPEQVASSASASGIEGQNAGARPALVHNAVKPMVASSETKSKALDEETQARLRQYLEEHDRSVGRRANQQQLVTFPNGSN